MPARPTHPGRTAPGSPRRPAHPLGHAPAPATFLGLHPILGHHRLGRGFRHVHNLAALLGEHLRLSHIQAAPATAPRRALDRVVRIIDQSQRHPGRAGLLAALTPGLPTRRTLLRRTPIVRVIRGRRLAGGRGVLPGGRFQRIYPRAQLGDQRILRRNLSIPLPSIKQHERHPDRPATQRPHRASSPAQTPRSRP
jgi:hypothetical protein